jgi:hypothetical protein
VGFRGFPWLDLFLGVGSKKPMGLIFWGVRKVGGIRGPLVASRWSAAGLGIGSGRGSGIGMGLGLGLGLR